MARNTMTLDTTTQRRPRRRLASLGASTMLVAVLVPPTTATAHGECMPMLSSAVHAVVEAVNVFSTVIEAKAERCVEQFEQVEPVMGREYEVASRARPGDVTVGPPPGFARCEDGLAAGTFPCDNVTMLGHVTLAELGVTFVNDMWGWTDPATRKDFALVGASEGTVFVDVTLPTYPIVRGILPTASTEGGAVWRDIKVHADHAFVVSEHDDHGVQVFDLTRLREPHRGYTTYDMDAHYRGVGSSHNIAINTDTGFAYVVGASPAQTRDDIACGFGLHIVDVNTPTDPTYAGCWDGDGYVHDAQCIVYDGPDSDHTGKEICFNATPLNDANDALAPSMAVVDVTDKADPVGLSDIPYATPGSTGGYSHQGWLTDDRGTYFHGDELDEAFYEGDEPALGTATRVWDVEDLDEPFLRDTLDSPNTSIDHNMYVEDGLLYQANYTTGLRILDAGAAASGQLEEVASFDVYPEDDAATFAGGAWNTYPYFRREGLVAVSSIDRGLFLLRPELG